MLVQIRNKSVDQAKDSIPDGCTLLCCASFEQRCATFPLTMDKDFIFYSYIVVNRNAKSQENINYAKIICGHHSKSEIVGVSLDNPIETADAFAKTLDNLLSNNRKLLIDITTFTHESLLILLKMVYERIDEFESIYCVYTGADNYSIGSSPEQMWLSKGCRDVRNIVGYPGVLRPSEKTCLIILTGFELERATRLIELLEPDRLVLGSGVDPTNENHADAMRHFWGEFLKWQNDYKNLDHSSFSFSCKDINKAVTDINNIIAMSPNENYILVPLNNKLSTIAASIVAFSNKKIQLCYAVPETYNYDNYSHPGDKITIVVVKGMD